jgi:protein-tyrosine phosphatase
VADVAQLRDELRIGAIIDLRSTEELRSEGRGRLADQPIRFHHMPLFDGEAPERDLEPPPYNLADRYFLLAEFARRQIARVITTLAETTTPAVYHCAAGKDRTGVVSAVILGILEVDDEMIVADYALTQENLDRIIDRLTATPGYRSMLAELPPDTLHARPETMSALLKQLRDKYGSLPAYARAAGVADATIEQLRERLID